MIYHGPKFRELKNCVNDRTQSVNRGKEAVKYLSSVNKINCDVPVDRALKGDTFQMVKMNMRICFL